ncbi:AAA family ATPase [Actinoplanes sp. NPDC026619]|uniref:AAA family ATPase n=1 Tax=Actinoplanes sp. NPDC026619 TaxID=3155798 RepID=UPI0033C3F6D6
MYIAGGSLRLYRGLSESRGDQGFPERCGSVVQSVIADWNPWGPTPRRRTTRQFIKDIVGARCGEVLDWLPTAPAPTGLDPRSFLDGDHAGIPIQNVLTGNAHGDLSARNILIKASPGAAAGDFRLIDYDHFAADAALANDPMHLLVALALDEYGEVRSRPGSYIDVIVNPDAAVPRQLNDFRDISRAIHEAVKSSLDEELGFGGEWAPQCQLALVGAALVHLGRTLHLDPQPHIASEELQQEAKQWCYDLAAAAATRFLDEHAGHGRRSDSRALPAPTSAASGRSLNTTVTDRDQPPVAVTELLGRDEQHRRLHTRLTDGRCGMVLLRGLPGMGKTKLLNVTLRAIETDNRTASDVRIREHLATRERRLDVRTLIDLISGESPTAAPAVGMSSLVRLEAVLKDLRRSPVIVAVDSAENLLDPRNRMMVDRDLDEAFAILSDEPNHRVSVILATQQEPVSPSAFGWPEHEEPIVVGRVRQDQFLAFLHSRDHHGMLELDHLPPERQHLLWQRLQGNPRLGELVCAIVGDHGAVDLPTVIDGLPRGTGDAVAVHLIGLLTDKIDGRRRDALHAVAALGTPVPTDAVADVLIDSWPPGEVRQAVKSLVQRHVCRRNDHGDVFLPPADAGIIMARMAPEARRELRFRAADVLTDLRTSTPSSVDDLRFHIAELNALIDADEMDAALGLIHEIDAVLFPWNCSYLLLEQRLAVRDKLSEHADQLSNENALAGIYLTIGELEETDLAYGRALKLAQKAARASDRVALQNNLGLLSLAANRTEWAQLEFAHARDEAITADDRAGQVGALEGLADCHRHYGEYEEAIACAVTAVDLAGDQPSRRLMLILKLARWHAELAEVGAARKWLTVAQQTAAGRRDDTLAAACLEGDADLLLAAGLDNGAVEEAVRRAHEAVDRAISVENPFVLRRARTTLCVAHLRLGQFDEAARQIRRAYHYRGPNPPLSVLALLALVTRLTEPVAAGPWFDQLLTQATARIRADARDFSARDFQGFARCSRLLERRDDIDSAVESFRTSDQDRAHRRARGLTARLRFMLRTLDASGAPPGQLAPVIAHLTDDT